MANVQMKFIDLTDSTTIEVNTNETTDFIRIYVENTEINSETCIYLDKSTAIKFAKTLRTEINKIK